MKLLDVPRGILFILLVCDTVHSCAGFLPESSESRIQRLGRDQMSDRKELSLRILLGQFGYSVDLCGHSVSRSEPRLCFLSPDTCTCSPLPSSGFRGRSFRSPAVPHLHRYYEVVRLLLHPYAVASGRPWLPRFRSSEQRWRALLGSWGIPLEACPELVTPATPARPCNSGRPDAAFRLVNGVGIAISRFSELSLRCLLPCCERFSPTSRPVNGNTRYRPACSLWPCGTCTRWTPSRSFTVSSSVPPLPSFSQRDNNVGSPEVPIWKVSLKL